LLFSALYLIRARRVCFFRGAGGIVDIVANMGAPSAYTMRAREVSVHGSGDAAGALAQASAVSVEMAHITQAVAE
jgi:hypothetical protein